MWWNPTDIKGPAASIHFNLSDALKLKVMGEWYSGIGKDLSGNTGLNTDDHINHYSAQLGYRMNPSWNLTLGAEWVDWNLKARGGFSKPNGNPQERWYNIGLGYNMSDMAKLSILWQVSDYDGKGATGFSPFGGVTYGGNGNANRARGSLITTQLSIKF